MIEEILIDYLSRALSIPVYAEVPVIKPSRYVIIEKTGSSNMNHIYSATIAIQSYSSGSMLDAMNMNERVKESMAVIPDPSIGRVTLNADYNFTNTNTKEYRYQSVFSITLAGGTLL